LMLNGLASQNSFRVLLDKGCCCGMVLSSEETAWIVL
jgi:hypothetical protein